MFLTLLKSSAPPPAVSTVVWFNVSGVWKQVIVWFNVSGVWKQTTAFVKIGGGFK